MNSIFNWVVGKISSATNSGAEVLLRQILTRFLEDPIKEDAFSLALFDDWTIRLTLRKSFIDVNMVNTYVPYVTFKSLYISNFDFGAAYNLSVFNLALSRVVIEINAKQNENITEPDADLTASIHEFQDQLPVAKNKGFMDWLLSSVQQIHFTLDGFTTIFNFDDGHENISLIISSVKIDFAHSPELSIELGIPNISIVSGQKRKQKSLVKISNFNGSLKDKDFNLSVESVEINLSKNVFEIVSILMNLLPKQINSTQHSTVEPIINTYVIEINNFTIKTSNSMEFLLDNTKIHIFLDHIDITFSRITLLHEGESIVLIEPQSNDVFPFASLVCPSLDEELTMFKDFHFPPKEFNSSKMLIFLPSLVVHMSKAFVVAAMELISWLDVIKTPSHKKTLSNEKASMYMNVQIPYVQMRMIPLNLRFSGVNLSLYSSSTMAESYQNYVLQISQILFQASPTFSLIQTLNTNEENCLSILYSSSEELGKDISHKLQVQLGKYLFRVPTKYECFNPLIEVLNALPKNGETTSVEISKQDTRINHFSAEIHTGKFFVDYTTLNMPARAILQMNHIDVSIIDGNSSPFSFCAEISNDSDLFFSNMRENLPLIIFAQDSFPALQYSFVHIAELKLPKLIIDYDVKRVIIGAEPINCNMYCCWDSLNVFLSFIAHVEYDLDNNAEQPEVREFDLPDHLLSFKSQVSQTLQLDHDVDVSQSILSSAHEFDNMEELINSVVKNHDSDQEEESTIEFSNDDDMVTSFEPSSTESTLHMNIDSVNLSLKIYQGRDLGQIYDLKPRESYPIMTDDDTMDFDFEIVPTRDEMNYCDWVIKSNLSGVKFPDDPLISMRFMMSCKVFEIQDHLPESPYKVFFQIEKEPDVVQITLDILKTTAQRTEISLRWKIPDFVLLVSQEQLAYYSSVVDINVPKFPSDYVNDEPLAVQYCEIVGKKVRISAHFRYWLDVNLDDIVFNVPKCSLFAIRGFDTMIGEVVEFYVGEITRPGAIAVMSTGLPVIKNIRRVGGAIRDLFTFDTREFGVGKGIAKSFEALLKIIATETLNAGANVTTIGERFLSVALEVLSGEGSSDDAMKQGVATLIIKNDENSLKQLPTMILAPGILSLQKLTEMFKSIRNRINPNFSKFEKYRK